jgi:glutamyl/glutaminyl-tRNA synthetase
MIAELTTSSVPLAAQELSKEKKKSTSWWERRPRRQRLLARWLPGTPSGFSARKIDMASANFNLREPVIYRILNASRPRTGAAWHIYLSYDFAHGQCDAIEEASHSLCTLEFEDHRPLYDWFLDNFPVPSRPRRTSSLGKPEPCARRKAGLQEFVSCKSLSVPLNSLTIGIL